MMPLIGMLLCGKKMSGKIESPLEVSGFPMMIV